MTDAPPTLCMHQATTLEQWSLPQAVEGYARHGIRAISVWAQKVDEVGAEQAARLIRDAGLTVTGYSVGGLMSTADPAERQAQHDRNRRMLDAAATLGSPCLVVIGGGVDPRTKDLAGARQRALDGLAELLPQARETGVTLALEPLNPMVCATRSVLCSMRQANDWCDALGGGAEVGIAVDTYNVWWDPELEAQIARATGRVAAFHVADWLPDTRDIRFDRGMLGDGVIDFASIRKMVESAGFDGFSEVEIFSRHWWREPADDVVALCVDRFRALL